VTESCASRARELVKVLVARVAKEASDRAKSA
jgi:hypothetical protein